MAPRYGFRAMAVGWVALAELVAARPLSCAVNETLIKTEDTNNKCFMKKNRLTIIKCDDWNARIVAVSSLFSF